MKLPLRKLVFWAHLISGIVFGVVVGIMSVTGVAIAFEKEIIAWAERDVRTAPPPSSEAQPLPIEELILRVREQLPEAEVTSLKIHRDPGQAYVLQAGRRESHYVNPYTGDIAAPGATGVRSFMRSMTDWHRWLGADGDGRATGRLITGVSNFAFLVLLITGLYIWIPRQWSWRVLRPSLWLTRGARGKARDWNWHNVVGLWTAPVLLVLIVSGVVISFPWASNLVYLAVGEQPPPPRRGPPSGGESNANPIEAPEGVSLLSLDSLLVHVQEATPDWMEITLPIAATTETSSATAANVTVKNRKQWPMFSSDQLVLHPYSGEVLSHSGFGDYSTGRQARSWLRFLHTGEAFGFIGKVVATIATAGGAILVYTGFALAIRRLIRWRGRHRKNPTLPKATIAPALSK